MVTRSFALTDGRQPFAADSSISEVRVAIAEAERDEAVYVLVMMTLAENLTQVNPLTPDDLKYGWHRDKDYKTELRPSGLLRLRFDNYFDAPIRREWLETEEKPLEGRLREVIVGLFIAAAAERRRAEAFA